MDGILLRVSCNFVADGVKTELQGEDLLEVEPLVSRVLVMVLRVVFYALFPRRKAQGCGGENFAEDGHV